MDIERIKAWLEECISLLEDNTPDTTPERIDCNRRLWGKAYRNREEVREWVRVNKPGALIFVDKLREWMVDYYKYFEPGYKPVSGETIDTLPGLIAGRLRFIKEKIESL